MNAIRWGFAITLLALGLLVAFDVGGLAANPRVTVPLFFAAAVTVAPNAEGGKR